VRWVDGGGVGVSPGWGARLPGLLAARAGGAGRAGPPLRRSRGVGFAPGELLFPQAELGLERGDLLLELGLPGHGAIEHRLVVGGLPPGLELLSQAWTDRARRLREARSRTGRGPD